MQNIPLLSSTLPPIAPCSAKMKSFAHVHYEKEIVRDFIMERVEKYAELTGTSESDVKKMATALEAAMEGIRTVPTDEHESPFGVQQCRMLAQALHRQAPTLANDFLQPALQHVVKHKFHAAEQKLNAGVEGLHPPGFSR